MGSRPSGAASIRSSRCESMQPWFHTTPHSPCSNAVAGSASRRCVPLSSAEAVLGKHVAAGAGAPAPDSSHPFPWPTAPACRRRLRRPKSALTGGIAHHVIQHLLGAVPVLNVGRMHRHCQQQPQGIDHYVTPPRYFLTRVVAARPPFSVVLTLWLSMIAALGLARRPTD